MKTIDNYDYYGCGFRVILHNVPMTVLNGEECPEIRFEELENKILLGLLYAPFKLTGEHIKFIRIKLHMNTTQFGEFLTKTHATVLNWENSGEYSTNMTDDTESMLRLKVLTKVFGPDYLPAGFEKIKNPKSKKAEILEFDPFNEEILEG